MCISDSCENLILTFLILKSKALTFLVEHLGCMKFRVLLSKYTSNCNLSHKLFLKFYILDGSTFKLSVCTIFWIGWSRPKIDPFKKLVYSNDWQQICSLTILLKKLGIIVAYFEAYHVKFWRCLEDRRSRNLNLFARKDELTADVIM